MRVWSPQTPYTAACGGGVPASFLSQVGKVTVTSGNQTLLAGLLGLLGTLCAPLLGIDQLCPGKIVDVSLTQILANSASLLPSLDLGSLNGLVAAGTLVNVPANGAIYVQENAVGPTPAPDPNFVQCLIGSALGMYSTVDTNLTAGLLDASKTPQAKCRAGKLFVDGVLDGKATAGVDGDIVIMSNLTYRTSDNADDDRLGLVATGPVEVYNPLQCVLAVGTCLTLQPLPSTLTAALPALMSAGTGNLTQLLALVPGYGQNIRIDAAVISLRHRFGMQLPVLSLAVNATLLNQLVNLNINPPTLTLNGSLAQKYRGIIAADLVNLNLGVPSVNLAGATVDIGYNFRMVYDSKLRTDPPPYLPAPENAIWDAQTFAELNA